MRVAVLGDIHSNLAALKAVLGSFEQVDAVWIVGDVTGYGAEPGDCVDLLSNMKTPVVSIAGNHDLGVLGRLDLDSFISEGREAVSWTRTHLTEQQLMKVPDEPELLIEEHDATLVHGSVCDPSWEYIVSEETANASLQQLSTSLCFFGHTHIPMLYYSSGASAHPKRLKPVSDEEIFLKQFGARWLINPGSVGQPRDRDSRASYLIFDEEKMTVSFRRCEYPVDRTAKKIVAAGLPQTLADRLAFGI